MTRMQYSTALSIDSNIYSINRLTDAASPLLTLAGQLEIQSQPIKANELKKIIIAELQQFHKKAKEYQYNNKDINIAFLALCETLEEVTRKIPNQIETFSPSLKEEFKYTDTPDLYKKVLDSVYEQPYHYHPDLLTFLKVNKAVCRSIVHTETVEPRNKKKKRKISASSRQKQRTMKTIKNIIYMITGIAIIFCYIGTSHLLSQKNDSYLEHKADLLKKHSTLPGKQ